MSLYEKFAPCDFAKWAKMDLWEAWEAAHILRGIEPPRAKNSSCAATAQPILDAITRAFAAGVLRPAPPRGDIVFFLPLEILDWAKKKELLIPNGLEEKVQANARVFIAITEARKADHLAKPERTFSADALKSSKNEAEKVEEKNPKTRRDNLSIAMDVGFANYKKQKLVAPTARALFDWLADNDETGKVADFDEDKDVLTWTRTDGGLSDTSFKSFQGRFTRLKLKKP